MNVDINAKGKTVEGGFLRYRHIDLTICKVGLSVPHTVYIKFDWESFRNSRMRVVDQMGASSFRISCVARYFSRYFFSCTSVTRNLIELESVRLRSIGRISANFSWSVKVG